MSDTPESDPESAPDSALQPPTDKTPLTQSTQPTQPTPARKKRNFAFDWLLVAVGAIIAAVIIRGLLFQAFVIPTESMEHTIDAHERVLVNKMSYRLHDVHRGDVVVFHRASQECFGAKIKDLIKRVIAVEGDSVEQKDGVLRVNGQVITEDYILDPNQPGKDFSKVVLDKDTFWVMGDNRSNSRDSRFCGPVNRQQIVGRAFMVMWPPSKVSFL